MKPNNSIAYGVLQLQNLIKRDPKSYYDEFYLQYRHYQSLLEAFKLKPQEYDGNLATLIMFLAQVSSCFKEDLEEFPADLITILREYCTVLEPRMRMCLCKALVLMRNRNVVTPISFITLCFELLRCNDKVLRQYLQVFIITDIKKVNLKHKNNKVNSVLQNFILKMISDSNTTAAKMSLDIMIELYRRNIWRDTKTVNAIATACFTKTNKMIVAASQFFLGKDEDEKDDKSDSSDSEDDTPNVREVMSANKVNKKSRKRMKILKRTKQIIKNSKKKKNEVFDFSAIHLIYDPQGMAEELLKKLEEMNERYEIKMTVMNLVSRLVGIHQLILLNFYTFLLRYLKPHQKDVTKILMFSAQASHALVPPDVMSPVLKTIANNFITERNSAEVITVGLNAIKEICIRCPLGIDEDLLHDLVEYKRYKNRNVQMAAKALIQLFRKINPRMLQRKFRDKPTEAVQELKTWGYGASLAKSYIPGSEVLSVEPTTDENIDASKDENENDSDGSWIDVSHSDDDLASSDDELEDNDSKVTQNPQHAGKPGCSNEKLQKNSTEVEGNLGESNLKTDNIENKLNDVDSKNEEEKAILVSQSRILSQEEFHTLKTAQLAKQVKFAKGKKRKLDEQNLEDSKRGEIVSLKHIEKLHKRPRPDKETRLSTVLEGREGREKFGSRKDKKNPHSSKTQKQHNKNKTFNMIKHKVRSKQKRSFKDKQIALRNALLKRKRNG